MLWDRKVSSIFDDGVIKKIQDNSFQNKIKDFYESTDSIYGEYVFLEKGKFTFPKLKNVAKNLRYIIDSHLYGCLFLY